MRFIVFVLALGLVACASQRDGDGEPTETHVCTQASDGLAECRTIGPVS
ncbi:hypothetical protein [Hoeflea sp.]|nr:hypothetical protein [Hoeflea sp.]MBC7281291.1 hypothetical protein [Hoeflea sp.]